MRLRRGHRQPGSELQSLVEGLTGEVTMPGHPRMLGEHRLGLDGPLQVPRGEKRGRGSLEDARVGLTDVEERLTDAEEQAGARVVLGEEVDSSPEEACGGVICVERESALTGVGEGFPRGAREHVGGAAGGRRQLERLEVVVRQHLGVVLAAAELLDPTGGREVLCGTLGARDLPVGNVADEQVAEGELALVDDGARSLAAHELPPLESVEALLQLGGVDPGE